MNFQGYNNDNIHNGPVLIEGDLTVDGDIFKPDPPNPPLTNVSNPLQESLNANNFRISNLGTATQLNDAISLSQSNQTYLNRNGGSMSGNISMTGNLVTNLGTAINNNDAISLSQANQAYVFKDGDTMDGDLSMGNNLITNLGAPVNNSDAVNKLYIDVNTIAKPINENLDMNFNRITNLPSPGSNGDPVNKSYFDSFAVQNPLPSNLNANNNTVTNLREPTSATEAATKNYVDQNVGNPGKLIYINDISDLPSPVLCLGQMLYEIPEDTTWFFTNDITVQNGFCMQDKTELRGNQNVTITFDESNGDMYPIFSRGDNITISDLTFFGGGGHNSAFNNPTDIGRGFFNCRDGTDKTKRFQLLNCNILSARRLGFISGYGTVNINNNFINGGGGDKSWYGNVISTNNEFFEGYPYEVFGGGAVDCYVKANTDGLGTLTGVDIFSRGSNIVVPSQVQLVDDNGYSSLQQISYSPFTPNLKFGRYITANSTHMFVGTPDSINNINVVDIYTKQLNGTYNLTQTVFQGNPANNTATVCSETDVLYFRYSAPGNTVEVALYELGFNPAQPTNYSFVGVVGNSGGLTSYAEALACYNDIATSNRYVLIGEPEITLGTSSALLYVQAGGIGAFQLDFTYTLPSVINFGSSVSITKNLVAINNLGAKEVYIYPDFINTPIILKPTDRTTYANWGNVVDISYNSTFNEVRIAISEPNRISGIVDSGTIYNIITGGVYIYYYDVSSQTIKENKTQILEYPKILEQTIISGLGFSMGESLQFNKNDNANTLIIGAPFYNTAQGVVLVYKFKTSNNSDNGSFFLGQILYGQGLTAFGNYLCGSNDNFLIYDEDTAVQGRVNVYKQGMNIATGSIDINKVSNGQLGILTLSGCVMSSSASVEHNNNKIVLFAGAQDPFADGSMLYMVPGVDGDIFAVNISGNIFHPRNYETAINVSDDVVIELATISANTFIRTGGVAPLLKYQDSETINTYNHPSVQKFEISSNAGIVDSTPILRNIYGLSDAIAVAGWTNISYANPEVNGIFDSSKRFALQCRLQTTTDPQIGDYIRQTPPGLSARKALIVGKEEKINANFQVLYLTDFTDVFYNEPGVDIVDKNNNFIAAANQFYLGDILSLPSFIYVYIDKDPADLKVSAVITYTDDGKDKTKAWRINYAEDGINYLNDDSLVVYDTNPKQTPDRTSVTILDSFTFKYGSRFKLETQFIDNTIYRVLEGIITAK